MFRNGEVNVETYIMKISVKVDCDIYNTEGSIENIENVFATLRDYNKKNLNHYMEYEKLRALLRAAKNFGAYKCWIKRIRDALHIDIYFNTVDGLADFSKNMLDAIASEVMEEF